METKTETKLLLTKKEAQELWGVRRGSEKLLELCQPIKIGKRTRYKRSDVLAAPDKLLQNQN